LIGELRDKVGERAAIRGWVNAVRDQKRMQFLIVRDETGLAQVVVDKQDPPSELNEQISALTAESAISVGGTVVADERVKLGGLELRRACTSTRSRSPSCRSPPTRPWTSASTGATSICAAPSAG